MIEERELLICVSSPPEITSEMKDMFISWTEGYSVEVVIKDIFKKKLENAQKNTLNCNNLSLSTEFVFRRPCSRDLDNCLVELIKCEVHDRFRTFELLEHFLRQPFLLRKQGQIVIQLPNDIKSFVIENYWGLDNVIVREVLIKRFTKSRKDIDDVADTTGLNLRKVTRQFDNIRRVYLGMEEIQKFECNILDYCLKNIGLDLKLARRYSCIVFLLYSKFNLVSKKRMQLIACQSLELCGALILSCLAPDINMFYKTFSMIDKSNNVDCNISSTTSSSSLSDTIPILSKTDSQGSISSYSGGSSNFQGNKLVDISKSFQDELDLVPQALLEGKDDDCWHVVWSIFSVIDTVDVDKQLLYNLRDIKNLLTGESLDNATANIRNILLEQGGSIITKKMIDLSRIRLILKNLIQIGSNLSQTREYRDFLEDLITMIIEPLEEGGLTKVEVQSFLCCCNNLNKDIGDLKMSRSISAPTPSPRDTFASQSSTSSFSTFDMGISSQSSFATSSMSKKLSRIDVLRKDWMRFLMCCRMCIGQINCN